MNKRKLFPILLATLALLFAAPADTSAQGFLKKMKQKAEKAINKVAGVDEDAYDEDEDDNRRNDDDAASSESSGNPLTDQPSATDKLPKLKQSSVVWDGEVTPSSAANARALLGELPALPTAEQIANPVQSTVDAYYRQLSALNMRAEELDEEQACSDEEMLAARDRLYDEVADVLGISAADMKRMEDPNISDAEREAIEKKIIAAATGGMGSMDGMGDALTGDLEAMQARNAKHQARLEELGREAEALEKKGKNLTPAEQKRAQEITAESQAIQQEIMGGFDMSGMGNIMQMGKKANALNNRLRKEASGDEKASKVFTDKLNANAKQEEGVVKSCEQIAADYEDDLRGIYEQIWAEDDATKIHALYDEADNLVKNYRNRAAKVYLRGLQLRLDNTKALMSDAEKIYSSMADDGLIPKCAMGRAPLNVVIQCIDILNEAYVDFPQPDVLCCKKSVIDFGLKPGEVLHNTESGYSGAMGAGGIGGMGGGGSAAGDTLALERDFLAKSRFLVYNEKEQAFYKLQNGTRTRLADDQAYNYAPAREHDDAYYGEVSLRGGDRKLTYSRSGTLTLHDGTTFQPVAMHRTGDWMVFIAWDYKTDSFARYMYKL